MELFKNKLFLMIFTSLFAICLFNSKCFASFDFTYNDVDYSLPDLPTYPYYCSGDNSSYPFIIGLFDSGVTAVYYPISSSADPNTGAYYPIENFKFYYDSNYRIHCKASLVDSGTVVSCNVIPRLLQPNATSWTSGAINDYTDNRITVVYSSLDIYESENSDTVVFQGASQPVEETNQVVLAEIVEQQETNKVMEEILGILPVIIVVLVSLIAIRKAIAFLRTLLHRS